jgi:rhodanese-related sulfurtransferase
VLACPTLSIAQDTFGGSRQPSQPSAPTTAPSTRPSPPVSTVPAPPGAGRTVPAPARPPASTVDPKDAAELQDYGVAASTQLHDGPMHGPTPTHLPGGLVVTTGALAKLLQDRSASVLLFDVLGGAETLPNALRVRGFAEPGTFTDRLQQQLVQILQTQTGGRRDMPLVFYCASTQCWMSYNAALRAVNAGYTNVLWYRGGIEAWTAAGLPLAGAPGR